MRNYYKYYICTVKYWAIVSKEGIETWKYFMDVRIRMAWVYYKLKGKFHIILSSFHKGEICE